MISKRSLFALAATTALFSSVSSAAPRRKADDEPTEIETINEGPEPDLQRIAVGGWAGGGWMTNRGSKGAAFADFALSFAFGLGPGGARVPYTAEIYTAFAVTQGSGFGSEVHPNRFTEIAARFVYRFPSGALVGRWISIGAGLVWTSRRPSSNTLEQNDACNTLSAAESKSRGLDCALVASNFAKESNLAPAALLDLGIGLQEWMVRTARYGFALRLPVQVSAFPGFGAALVFYGQIGLYR